MQSFLMSSQFKIFASLNSQHSLKSAVELNTLKPQHNLLLCSFSLFPENWLSLLTITTLLPALIPLFLGIQKILTFLVLCHFVRLVLATLFIESSVGLRYIHHVYGSSISIERKFIYFFTLYIMFCNAKFLFLIFM